jgi:hypothetical protein
MSEKNSLIINDRWILVVHPPIFVEGKRDRRDGYPDQYCP